MATNGNVNGGNNSGWVFTNAPRTLIANSGTYAVAGKAAVLARPNRAVLANNGIYALDGQAAEFNFPIRVLSAENGIYAVAGSAAIMASSGDKTGNINGGNNSGWVFARVPRVLIANNGVYAIIGKAANIVRVANKTIAASKGDYAIVGNSATITYENAFSLTTPTLRYADFFRLTTASGVYLFSTAPFPITVPSVSAEPFTALGQLIKVGGAQRDIKSTANETTITMVGIDTAMLGIVLAEKIKGSKIELWHGFFNSQNQLVTATGTGLYQYFSGYVNTFSISEEWMEDARSFAGAITISASSFQLILQNRTSGRYTNDAAWKAVNPTDTSMNRVNFISTINYAFGKTPT
jgi:hypothetical protein